MQGWAGSVFSVLLLIFINQFNSKSMTINEQESKFF
jgi:hypothetical protein